MEGGVEKDLSQAGAVARGILHVLDADVREAGKLLGGEGHAAGGGNVVVHDGEAAGLADLAQELTELGQVGGVVEGRDNHDGVGARLGSVLGEVDAAASGEVAGAGDDGDTASRGLDAELGDLLALLGGEGDELARAAAGDEAVDTSLDETLDVGVESGAVDGPVIREGGGEGHHDTGKFLRHFDEC